MFGLPALRGDLVVAVLLLFTGCATGPPQEPVRRVTNQSGSGVQSIDGSALVVGGVVLAADLVDVAPLDLYASWAAALQEHLQTRLATSALMPRPVLEDMVDPALLAVILEDYAHVGRPDAGHLRQMASELKGPRGLVLVRVEKDELDYRELDQHKSNAAQHAKRAVDFGRPLMHAETDAGDQPRSAPSPQEALRKLTASIDILDLETGKTLWSARVVRHRKCEVTHNSVESASRWAPLRGANAGNQQAFTGFQLDVRDADFKMLLNDCLEALTRDLLVGK